MLIMIMNLIIKTLLMIRKSDHHQRHAQLNDGSKKADVMS